MILKEKRNSSMIIDYFSDTTKLRRPSLISRPRLLIKKSVDITNSQSLLYETIAKLEQTKELLAEATARLEITQAELEKTKEYSFIDTLTGCYNRNYFNKYRLDHFDKNRDHNRIGVVLADINDLKKINDKHGHEAGDELIKKSAETLRGVFRKDDIVIRLGGDEFLVICTNFSNSDNFEYELSKAVCEKLTHSRIAIAFGAAVFNSAIDESLSNTVARADELMYENKRSNKEYLSCMNAIGKKRR